MPCRVTDLLALINNAMLRLLAMRSWVSSIRSGASQLCKKYKYLKVEAPL